MTPAARIAAAIEVLDRVVAGTPAEAALTTWGRGNRFAGSKDRAAIRDHVFDALRRRRSLAMLGGGETGRATMIGALRAEGRDPRGVFTGEAYAPATLTDEESDYRAPPERLWPDPVRLDYPDWLDAPLRDSLGADFEPVLRHLRSRAPVFLRVNVARTGRDEMVAALSGEGISSEPHPLCETALVVTENARAIARSEAYQAGLIELQDVASQAAAALCGPGGGRSALDYCAGGGGKALALSALGWHVTAHDALPRRMADLPARAARAGVDIALAKTEELAGSGSFDLVFVDAPCSGSGAWRRQAEARWLLTPGRLDDLVQTQASILADAARLVRPGGRLAYATCSLLRGENEDRVSSFLAAHPGWSNSVTRRFSPLEGGDGFFFAMLEKTP